MEQMEQDDIKLLWKQLNEKINASEIVNKQTLMYILHEKRKTARQRLMSADLTATLFFFFLALGLSYVLFRDHNGFMLLKVQAVGLLLFAGVINCLSYRKLAQLKWEAGVSTLFKQVAAYKRIIFWSYFISYVAVIVFGISFLCIYPQASMVKIALSLLFPACIAIDCFIYRWSFSQLRTMTDTTKELKELNQWAD